MGFYADTPIPELYRWFADETAATSPVWERMSLWVAEQSRLVDRLEALEGETRQPNRFLAALRFLGGPIVPGPALEVWLDEHWAEAEHVIRTRITQTNEPGRLRAIAPLLATLPQPLALLELGASAGLCLLPDLLAPQPGLEVAARLGLDRNPLDAADPETRRWLAALVWPGEDEREARLHAALEVAAETRPTIRRADLTDDVESWLPTVVEEVRAEAPESTPVVLHSTTLGYLPRARRARVVDAIRASGARWVSFEPDGVVPGVPRGEQTLGPAPASGAFVLALDGLPVAWSQAHGGWVRWREGGPVRP